MVKDISIHTLEDLADDEYYGYDINNLSKHEWLEISSFSELSERFIREYHEKLDWVELIDSGALNESLLNDFSHNIVLPFDWEKVAINYENLSNDFLEKFLDKFSPHILLEYQKISAKLLYKIIKKYPDGDSLAEDALIKQAITPQKIRAIEKANMEYVINWYEISKSGKISRKNIEKLKNELNWRIMSLYREFSEDDLLYFKDYVDWGIASEHQKLTKKIILELPNEIDVEKLKLNQKINQEEFDKEGIYAMLILLQTS